MIQKSTHAGGLCRVAALVLAVLAGWASGAPSQAGAAWGGEFSAPFAEDPTFNLRPPRTNEEAKRLPTAVHMAMMPDGRIVYWGGLEGAEDANPAAPLDGARVAKPARSRILDLRSGAPRWSSPSNNTGGPTAKEDLFCVDQRVLADGRVLAVGGSIPKSDPVDLAPITGPGGPGGTFEYFGSTATRWLDFRPDRPAWAGGDANRMHKRRWYPALVTLADGRLLVASGVGRLTYNVPPLDSGTTFNVLSAEVFNPATNRWTRERASADASLPLYPRLHLSHDGRVIYTGVGQMWSPFGQAPDEAIWNLHKAFDPRRHRWTITGIGRFGARSDAFSVPLMLKPPYDRTAILVAGGSLGVSPSTYLATPLSEIVSYRNGGSSSLRTGNLNHPRWFSTGVLLPDGKVMALSGGDKNENLLLATAAAVRQAELFDPSTRRWTPLASARRDRTYHNTAMLLPDARVLVGGHAPLPFTGPNSPTAMLGLTANNAKDPSFEIFTPPYLDPARGPRPSIAFAPAGMGYSSDSGPPVDVRVTGSVSKLVLMRLPSPTHATDADQRGIKLAFTRVGPGELRVAPPPSGNVAPPGYYYLFALSDRGVPSKARIVQVGPRLSNSGPAPAPFGA